VSDLSTKTVCVVDNGLFVDFARLLGKTFKKVYYTSPWKSSFPTTQKVCVGRDFPEIERINFPLKKADSIDLWVFFDLYHADEQQFLIDHGARVWGARWGEEFELYRWQFKQYLKRIGLPVQPVEHVIGIDALRELLKRSGNKHVKTSFVRGDFETFHHLKFKLTEPRLDEIEHVLGPFKDDYEFIVEDDIPKAIEIGYDGFTIDGQFPSHSMQAFEIKDVGMLGMTVPYKSLAKPILEVNDKLVDAFRGHKYRSFFCSEIRYTKDHTPFFIDPCCRLGTPSNELLQHLFEGWPQVLWHGAEGELKSPTVKAKFGCLIVLHSEWAVSDWQTIHYPKSIDEFVKLRFHSRHKGVDCIPPQTPGLADLGGVVGTGDTVLEAIETAVERARQVEGHQLEFDVEAIPRAIKVVEEAEKYGIHFTSVMPSPKQLTDLVVV
jgi:hypothetical protein